MISVVSTLLGLVALVLVYLELAGKEVPLIPQGFRAGFIALAVIGILMCSIGGRIAPKAGETVNWGDPLIISGIVLGTLALLATISMIFFKKVPFMSDKTAFIVLAVLVLVKFVINIVRFWGSK